MEADLLVFKGPLDRKDFKGDRVHKDLQALQELLVLKDHKAAQVHKGQLDQLEEQVQLAFSAQLPLQWE